MSSYPISDGNIIKFASADKGSEGGMLAKSILGVFYIYNDNYVYTRVISVDYYYY